MSHYELNEDQWLLIVSEKKNRYVHALETGPLNSVCLLQNEIRCHRE